MIYSFSHKTKQHFTNAQRLIVISISTNYHVHPKGGLNVVNQKNYFKVPTTEQTSYYSFVPELLNMSKLHDSFFCLNSSKSQKLGESINQTHLC